MWLYFLSVLAIGSVNSVNIGYPYRILFNSAPFQSKAATPQGFLIYIDNLGTERIVSYNYAEPIYAVRRLTFINREANEFIEAEYNKAREAHFRAWSLQQYQVLKREIDFLRGEGKEPSNVMILKFLPLEKIALTSDFSTIAGLPEIKRVQEEHLDIWKDAFQAEEEQQIKPNIKVSNVKLKPFSNTELKDFDAMQRNAQSMTTEASTIETANNNLKISNAGSPSRSFNNLDNVTKIVSKNITFAKEQIEATNKNTTISETGKEDDQKLKIQFGAAENSVIELNSKINANTSVDIKMQESIKKGTYKIENLEICIKNGQNQTCSSFKDDEERPLLVKVTEEVMKAGEEHLKLVIKANKQKVISEVEKLIFEAPAVYVPKQVVDTDEVKRAREEHLKIVNEAILKAKLAQALKRQGESSTDLSKMT